MAFRGQTPAPGGLPAARPGPGPGGHPAPGKAPRSVARTRPGPDNLPTCPRVAPAAPRPSLGAAGLGCPRSGCSPRRAGRVPASPTHKPPPRPFPRIFLSPLSRAGTSRADARAGGRTQGRLLPGAGVGARGWQCQRWGHLRRGCTAEPRPGGAPRRDGAVGRRGAGALAPAPARWEAGGDCLSPSLLRRLGPP